MLINWWKTRTTLSAINSALIRRRDVKIVKHVNDSNINIHCYCFSTIDHQSKKRIRGSGTGFTDQMGIVRAWGEFVERYSFRLTANSDASATTSNGFASHISREQAKENALAELVERDVFLSAWLLRLPASTIDHNMIHKKASNRKHLEKIRARGFEVQIGIIGECMDFLVGMAVIYSPKVLVVATTAKRTIHEVIDHLVRDAIATVSDFSSPQAPLPIETLPEDAQPMDHLKYYLNASSKEFLEIWFQPTKEIRTFPSFTYELEDLTATNTFANQTGYFVYRAKSKECQNLCFGTTKPNDVNLERLTRITERKITYEEVNHDPHPMA